MATFVKFDEERFLNMDLVTQISWDRIHKQFLVWVVARAKPFVLDNDERLVMNRYLDTTVSTNAYESVTPEEEETGVPSGHEGHEGHENCRYAPNAADDDCPFCRGVALAHRDEKIDTHDKGSSSHSASV